MPLLSWTLKPMILNSPMPPECQWLFNEVTFIQYSFHSRWRCLYVPVRMILNAMPKSFTMVPTIFCQIQYHATSVALFRGEGSESSHYPFLFTAAESHMGTRFFALFLGNQAGIISSDSLSLRISGSLGWLNVTAPLWNNPYIFTTNKMDPYTHSNIQVPYTLENRGRYNRTYTW